MALDFSLTPEQEEIRALAHEFAEKEMRPQADYFDENEETPWEVMGKAHELGIGPAAAQRIIAHRDEYGAFATPEALADVEGLGSKRVAELLDRIRV